MSKIDAFKAVEKAVAFAEEADGKMRKLKSELAVFSKHDIGDEVEVTGYSFRGKRMIITAIIIRRDHWKYRSETTYYAIYRGTVLKKDGTLSLNSAENREELIKIASE